ncbi:uncharacterized protein LOC123628223 [Lemur catta]|uniref:uncharacterized protein LOC123628223 n=1 Tax=Lemur catta TaxID=9447 RepID=UPI001E26D58F|nr:uncharacterized protein LOC123628223 [Lemur catta]
MCFLRPEINSQHCSLVPSLCVCVFLSVFIPRSVIGPQHFELSKYGTDYLQNCLSDPVFLFPGPRGSSSNTLKTISGPDGQPSFVFPTTSPDWDPNEKRDKEALGRYRQTLLEGIGAAAKKPINLSKVSETVQGPNESPAVFLECLFEAYRLYIPIDPEAPENRRAINIDFATQSAPDIRKKLQRLERFKEKLLSELIEIAQKFYNNREDPETAHSKRMAKILISAMVKQEKYKTEKGKRPKRPEGNTRRRKTSLSRDQCAYCKEHGHWKNECPHRKQEVAKPVSPHGGHRLRGPGLHSDKPPGAQGNSECGGQNYRVSDRHRSHQGSSHM